MSTPHAHDLWNDARQRLANEGATSWLGWLDNQWGQAEALQEDEPPQPPPELTMPTMREWVMMYLITLAYWILYHGWGADACGEEGTEPRWTWEMGGTFWEGFRAMWGV